MVDIVAGSGIWRRPRSGPLICRCYRAKFRITSAVSSELGPAREASGVRATANQRPSATRDAPACDRVQGTDVARVSEWGASGRESAPAGDVRYCIHDSVQGAGDKRPGSRSRRPCERAIAWARSLGTAIAMRPVRAFACAHPRSLTKSSQTAGSATAWSIKWHPVETRQEHNSYGGIVLGKVGATK